MTDRGVFYDGPSLLTGRRIIGVVTGCYRPTSNRKTGRMAQTWILPGVDPVSAVRSGRDADVCGDCPLRGDGFARRSCYVNVGQAPLAVWRSWAQGLTPAIRRIETPYPVRLGAYGDPAAIPFDVWAQVLGRKVTVGYTHQWRTCDPRFRDLLMASVETRTEKLEANRLGWRTFRIQQGGRVPVYRDEIECPAVAQPYVKTCSHCVRCSGSGRPLPNISTPGHGVGAIYLKEVRR